MRAHVIQARKGIELQFPFPVIDWDEAMGRFGV